MREKLRDFLKTIWLLDGSDEQIQEIEKEWGIDKFFDSYFIQEVFSKRHGGRVVNLEKFVN